MSESGGLLLSKPKRLGKKSTFFLTISAIISIYFKNNKLYLNVPLTCLYWLLSVTETYVFSSGSRPWARGDMLFLKSIAGLPAFLPYFLPKLGGARPGHSPRSVVVVSFRSVWFAEMTSLSNSENGKLSRSIACLSFNLAPLMFLWSEEEV